MTLTVDEFRAFRDNVFAKFGNIRADIARLNDLISGGITPEAEAEIRQILQSVDAEAGSVADITPEP